MIIAYDLEQQARDHAKQESTKVDMAENRIICGEERIHLNDEDICTPCQDELEEENEYF